MAHIKLLSLLLSMFLAIVNAFQVLQPTHVAEVDLRAAYPEPTPRALMGEENPNIIGRSYYNTLCGYADGNLSKYSSYVMIETMLMTSQTIQYLA